MSFMQRFMKPMLKRKAEAVSDLVVPWAGKSILDVGAGRAYIAKRIQQKAGVKVTCVDIDDLNQTDLPYVLYDGKTLPMKDNSFDSAMLVYVLHHCEVPEDLLKETLRVAKRVIIFEDLGPYPLTQILDYLVNTIIHNVKAPLNFKRHHQWLKTFKKFNLKLVHQERGVEKAVERD
jgi:ubiquinone/menaquinone biosynthesis C-methylase UbiE